MHALVRVPFDYSGGEGFPIQIAPKCHSIIFKAKPKFIKAVQLYITSQ
eukprot:SAG31_NODE_1094_length_9945_cov_3.834349_17_plen_48_part_00